MTTEIKALAQEIIREEIAMGFFSAEEVAESVSEQMEQEDDLDPQWLEEEIANVLAERRREAANWQHPTDFERLARAFDALVGEGIVALHFAGYTQSDALDDVGEAAHYLHHQHRHPKGFCYYHQQDVERALDPDAGHLMLGFGSFKEEDAEADAAVGKQVQRVLQANGFTVEWDGKASTRLNIKAFKWRKLPDEEVWGIGRVIAKFPQASDADCDAHHGGHVHAAPKRPWWKFW